MIYLLVDSKDTVLFINMLNARDVGYMLNE